MMRLFGTDGVRGEANTELTAELAYHLGRAATLYFGAQSEVRPRILIGRDTRISGEMFEAALTAGICSAGGIAMMQVHLNGSRQKVHYEIERDTFCLMPPPQLRL